MIKSKYLQPVFTPERYRQVYDRLLPLVDAGKGRFQAIAFTGTSGAALGFPIALALGLPILYVHKGSKRHMQARVEGKVDVATYAIIDDFIETGATLRRINREIINACTHDPVCTHVFLYNEWANDEESPAIVHKTFPFAKLDRFRVE